MMFVSLSPEEYRVLLAPPIKNFDLAVLHATQYKFMFNPIDKMSHTSPVNEDNTLPKSPTAIHCLFVILHEDPYNI